MVGTTRARTAGLAFLFVLGLILHGAAAEFSLHQRDFPSSTRDGWTASAVMTPALPAAARTQLLRNGVGPWTGTADSDGATLASGPSGPGALGISAVLLSADQRPAGVAPWHPRSSRAPPSAL